MDVVDVPTKDARLWGMLAHLSALLGVIGIPFAHIIAPAVILFTKGEQEPFVKANAKEALNFQITVTIYAIVAGILILLLIGIVLLIALVIADVVLTIIAGIKANDGELYRYPFTIRLIT